MTVMGGAWLRVQREVTVISLGFCCRQITTHKKAHQVNGVRLMGEFCL
jgi:hypothetical protein